MINTCQFASHAIRARIKLFPVNYSEYMPALTDNESAIREVLKELTEGHGLVKVYTLHAVRTYYAFRAQHQLVDCNRTPRRACGPCDEITIAHPVPGTSTESG